MPLCMGDPTSKGGDTALHKLYGLRDMGHEREAVGAGANPQDSLDSRLLAAVDAAYEHAADRAASAVRELGDASDLAERFEAALRAVLATAAAHPDQTRLCLVEAPGLGAGAVASREAGLQRFVDLLDRELGRGGPPPPLVSEMVVGGIYEVMQRTARGGEMGRLPELADQLSELWLPALRGR